MAKRAKVLRSPAAQKVAGFLPDPQTKKSAKIPYEIDAITAKKIGWNFHRMDNGGPWPCTFRKLTAYRESILSYEGKSIEDILNMRHCHPISCDVLCEKAQNRLNRLNINGNIFQLDIGGSARLWGILQHNIFHLLWVDPSHEVYPSSK